MNKGQSSLKALERETEIHALRAKLAVAVSALKTGVGYEPLQGLEPRPFSEALAKIGGAK